MRDPSVTANAYVNQWLYASQNAEKLVESLSGKGKIVAMLPIAGSSAAVVQLAALKAVIAKSPGIELLSTEYGDWDRAKAKQLTENLLQRFPKIDGVFSPAGQMSLGVYEAFDEAGRLGELTFSPGDDYNGWTKLVAKEGKGIFPSPTVFEAEFRRRYNVQVVGRVKSVRQQFYAISVQRRIQHPAVLAIVTAARQEIFD